MHGPRGGGESRETISQATGYSESRRPTQETEAKSLRNKHGQTPPCFKEAEHGAAATWQRRKTSVRV